MNEIINVTRNKSIQEEWESSEVASWELSVMAWN